jgi:hypothetical protein
MNPSDRIRRETDAPLGDRRAKARRGAWLLGLSAVALYLGYIAWNLLRGSAGG